MRVDLCLAFVLLASAALAAACGTSGDQASANTNSVGPGGGNLGGSGGASGGPGGNGSGASQSTTSATTTGTITGSGAGGGSGGSGGGTGGFTTVFTILFENHDYDEIVGSPDAPYMNSLIGDYGLATNYFDSMTHPSLPNYLYMISGDTQYPGFVDVNPDSFPYFPSDDDNLGNQLETAGIEWRSYQESMGNPCMLDNNYPYAPKHNPFLYFSNIQNDPNICNDRNVDYDNFAADLASGTYRYMFITPNLINDGHDPSNDPEAALQQSDDWLAAELPKILSSAVYQAGGVVFITWDEAQGRDGNDGDKIPMIVVSSKVKRPGFKTDVRLDHASYLATMQDIFGLPRLKAAQAATNLFMFFQ